MTHPRRNTTRSSLFASLCSVLLITAAMGLAQAQQSFDPVEIPLVNPGFEEAELASGAALALAPGWQVAPNNGQGTFRPSGNSFPAGVPEGEKVAYITNGPNPLYQLTDEVMELGMVYTLSVKVGDRRGTIYGGYRVALLSEDDRLLTERSSPRPANGGFATVSMTYTPTAEDAGKRLAIRLDAGQSRNIIDIYFDDVRLDKRLVDFNMGGENSGTYVVQGQNDQGFFINIGKAGNRTFLFFAWFTFDEQGNPLWLVGNDLFEGADGSNDIVMDVFAYSGLPFLSFSDDRADQELYGRMRFILLDCGILRANYDFGDRGVGHLILEQLTGIEGREDCVNPFIND